MVNKAKKIVLESTTQNLKCGGSVSFPYKSSMKSWYSQPSIGYIEKENDKEDCYVISGTSMNGFHYSEDAVKKFIDCIFNEKNLWVN